MTMNQQIPRRRLEPADIKEIHNALVEAYDAAELDRLLGYEWGIRLGREFGMEGGDRAVFGRLVDWTQKEGRTLELLATAWADRPGNDYLYAAKQRLLPDLLERAPDKLREPPKLEQALEAAVNARSELVDYGALLARLILIGRAICKIETATKTGTGFLIGKRTVLTNYHVIEDAAANMPLGQRIICRFDYHKGAAGEAVTDVPVRLANAWLGQNAPFSNSDLTGSGEPAEGELDFALLNLAEPVGELRGWFPLPEEPSVVLRGDVVAIAQHPEGVQLAMAYGQVAEFPAEGLRYRYDVTTAPGASGAPVLSDDLELIGLHHAAEPDANPRYNQGIPAHLIASALRDAGVDPGGL